MQMQLTSVEHKATPTACKYAEVSKRYRTDILLHLTTENMLQLAVGLQQRRRRRLFVWKAEVRGRSIMFPVTRFSV